MLKSLFILSFILFSLNAHSRSITLALPWKHQFQFAGYYIAKEKGFYEKVGLDVHFEEYSDKIDYIANVASSKSHFGVAHSSLIFQRYNQYDNLILLNAIHQSSPLALASLKYKDLADIVDKKVMITNDQTTIASINAMLHSKNLTKDSYSTINTSFTPIDLLSEADFMSIYLSNEPYKLQQKGLEYYIFHPRDYGYDFYSDILFTSKEMLQNNQKEVDDFRRASLMGWKYAYENIDETVELILKSYNTQNKTRDALLYEAKTLKRFALLDGVNFGDINPAKIQEITTAYRLLGLIESNMSIEFSSFVYASKDDFQFIFTEEIPSEYYTFLHSIYFRFILILFISIVIVSIAFKVKTGRLLKEQKEQLKLNDEIFNKHISSSLTNTQGIITSVSDAFCECTGYTREELISKTHNILKDPSTPEYIYKDLWMTILSGHTWKGRLKNRKKDNTEYWISMIVSPVFDNNKKIIAYKSITTDITLDKVLENFNETLENQVKEKTKELEILAMTDKLTGIYNRVKLDNDLALNFTSFEKFNENFSVIIIDIDNFKHVNDNYGHQVGDKILQEVTLQIKNNIRSSDILGRWGGEEFLIICPNSDKETAYILAEKLRVKIDINSFSRVKKLTICAGVCDMRSANDVEKMVSFADTALYEAKNSGRNKVLKYKNSYV